MSLSLEQTYRNYIACINAKTMTVDLPKFCHHIVTHNYKSLTLSQYQSLMSDAQDCIQDLYFDIVTLIVDEEKQCLAAELQFTGMPVKRWEGIEPNGKWVEFGEHVFYWFAEGKIKSVRSIVDVESYRRQMQGREGKCVG